MDNALLPVQITLQFIQLHAQILVGLSIHLRKGTKVVKTRFPLTWIIPDNNISLAVCGCEFARWPEMPYKHIR